MIHFSTNVESADQAYAFLAQADVACAVAEARSILVQIYVSTPDLNWIALLVEAVRSAAPGAIIAGATSAGEICEGRVSVGSTIISLSAFSSTVLRSALLRPSPMQTYDAPAADEILGGHYHDAKALLALAPSVSSECTRSLARLIAQFPHAQIMGGYVGTNRANDTALVFLGDDIVTQGVVVVALCGEELQVVCRPYLGWKALGPSMAITQISDFVVETINDQPAADVYRHYLGLDPFRDLHLLEFPLLVERDGRIIARNPVSTAGTDGLKMIADLYVGEHVRLGYADVDAIIEDTRGGVAKLAEFAPEAIFLFSCVCRRFALQQDVLLETMPYQAIAPTVGFFTFGEYFSEDGHLQVLNSTMVVVGLREGNAPAAGRQPGDGRDPLDHLGDDPYRVRHIRATSRLFQFIGALTSQLEEANRKLRTQADCDPLTGVLNRRVFDETLTAEVSRSARYNRDLALVLIDLDHFKRVNDVYGHVAGDHVLIGIASTIADLTRRSDVFCRYGGEEFALLLPETGLAGAHMIAERIRVAIERLELFDGDIALPAITASIGIACQPHHGQDAKSILIAADSALYRAKAQGRNRICAADGVPVVKPLPQPPKGRFSPV
ncbi:MAG: GGDEF domain-containing protein [Rhodospirillales bacterium]|nr:GGDEF domain-containing protein [Rhodospirillales bacterium]